VQLAHQVSSREPYSGDTQVVLIRFATRTLVTVAKHGRGYDHANNRPKEKPISEGHE